MSKANDKAMALLERNHQSAPFKEAFEKEELAPTFRTVFNILPLTEDESEQIHEMLTVSGLTREEVQTDHITLKDITTQIRAIEKQSTILHGERIHKAQTILKKYRDGTFSKWLYLTYGNRQTPYRMLQFYELFMDLAGPERELISAMPKRAAYALASRSGTLEKKAEIIKIHHNSAPDEIIQIVQETFPLKEGDRRKRRRRQSDEALLKEILPRISKLKSRKSLEAVLKQVEKLLTSSRAQMSSRG